MNIERFKALDPFERKLSRMQGEVVSLEGPQLSAVLAHWPRLALTPFENCVLQSCQFSLFYDRDAMVSVPVRHAWLKVSLSLQASAQCQRCLEPIAKAYSLNKIFLLVGTLDEENQLKGSLQKATSLAFKHQDPWLLEKTDEREVLWVEPNEPLNLFEFLEEELLLSLPSYPTHDKPCEVSVSAG